MDSGSKYKYPLSMPNKKLEFVSLENLSASDELKNSPVSRALVDIFDGSLWTSKVSLIGNLVLIIFIILSSSEVVVSSLNLDFPNQHLLLYIYNVTSIIFVIEIILRISLSGYLKPEYQGVKGKLNYFFTFYNVIDIFSILPFFLLCFGLPNLELLKSIKILRTWRLMRYVPSSKTILNAFKIKRDEILVSLFLVGLISLTISTFLFYVENIQGRVGFSSIMSAFIWSIGKYTGDYGGISHYEPITKLGQFFATLNGLMGIALFALPAGLLGSAFIDELGERKHRFRNSQIANLIGNHRYNTFDHIQSKLLFSDEEIIKAIRVGNNLRFRAVKSSTSVMFNDVKIIEKVDLNTLYGYKKIKNFSNVTIINCFGNVQRGLSHFSRQLSERLGYNFISKELNLTTTSGKTISGIKSMFYAAYYKNLKLLPHSFRSFRNDMLNTIKENNWVIILLSSANFRKADFHFTFGNSEGSQNDNFEESTIIDQDTFLKIFSSAQKYCCNIPISKSKIHNETITFKVSQHTAIGSKSKEELGFFLHREKCVNVLTLYINTDILAGDDNTYNAGLDFLVHTFEESLGKFNVES